MLVFFTLRGESVERMKEVFFIVAGVGKRGFAVQKIERLSVVRGQKVGGILDRRNFPKKIC